MIIKKSDLKKILKLEKKNYKISFFSYLLSYFGASEKSLIWRFQKSLRKWEYHLNNNHMFKKNYYKFIATKLGLKYGLNIPPNVFDEGLHIKHLGNILINGSARVGKNCVIHINTAIVATSGSSIAPIIGDNCYLGVGSTIVGEIKLGNNIIVGAGAVVTKSFENDNVKLVGVPATKI